MVSVGCELVSPRWRSVFDIRGLGGDLTPLGQRRCAALFEGLAINDVAFGIEVVLDVGVDGERWLGKFGQWDEWIAGLKAARMAAAQEA